MHHRQLSAGTAVELGRAFDTLLSAAPTKGISRHCRCLRSLCTGLDTSISLMQIWQMKLHAMLLGCHVQHAFSHDQDMQDRVCVMAVTIPGVIPQSVNHKHKAQSIKLHSCMQLVGCMTQSCQSCICAHAGEEVQHWIWLLRTFSDRCCVTHLNARLLYMVSAVAFNQL